MDVWFIWQTGSDLPAIVASHFTLTDAANGHATRAAYLGLMLSLVILMPLGTVATGWLAGRLPPSLVNLPRRKHWLAPERRAATVRSLCDWLAAFGAGLVALLCFAHQQVVDANRTAAVALPATRLGSGLALFFVATLVWLIAFHRRFARVP